jgi:hypothetical protein
LDNIASVNKADWNANSLYQLIGMNGNMVPEKHVRLKIVTEEQIKISKGAFCLRTKKMAAFIFQICGDPIQRKQCACFCWVMIFLY